MNSSGSYTEDDRDDDRISNDLRDKPLYLLEHLATFTVNKESGIVLPADGIRRLLHLEKTTGIWSQKMQLCLDREWVLIVDYESGAVIERFPASLVKEPTAFTSNSPMDMYNNVLVFIVGGGPGSRSEMHIFQCQNTSAVKIVEDLKIIKNEKVVKQHRSISMTPSPILKPQKLIYHGRHSFDNHECDSDGVGSSTHVVNHHITNGNPHHLHFSHHDEVSSTVSCTKYERDVAVLNHCFDDIEKFIARLQHVAAASRELERRRIMNRKSKKKSIGDGLLTLRTKPPYEKEFIDIFAKFKLSFNLLAKLKSHIHDPNAPELVHFLFTPLALIVDASHDPYYNPNISARVVDPMLTREAINLLCNCVTSKETELWRSLGEAWTVPKDLWKGHIGSYHPVFFDGWSPDYPVIDDLNDVVTVRATSTSVATTSTDRVGSIADTTTTTTIKTKKHRDSVHSYLPIDYEYDSKYNPPGSPGLREYSAARSDISNDSIERVGGTVLNAWLEDIQLRGGRIVQGTHPRIANNDKELNVMRGEFLEVLDDTRKWWKCRNIRGQIGHVPHTIIVPFNFTDILLYNPMNPMQLPNFNRTRARYINKY